MIHRLKIFPCYYEAVARGEKNFEIRFNGNRGFQKGDTVLLQECEQEIYTGRELMVEITYVSNYQQKENFVVFGFVLLDGDAEAA